MTIDPNTAPTELLPCPFCGSTDIATDGPSYTLFMCNECGGQTYDQDSHAEALAAWNRRAPTAMQPDGLVERDTHLLEWLPGAFHHCQHGSQDWCESYLNNAVDVIKSQDAIITSLRAEVQQLKDDLYDARLPPLE